MTDTPPPALRLGTDRRRILRDLARSLILNAVIPYATYRLIAPHFPSSSVAPLLYSTISPTLALFYGLMRKRAVDAIGILVILELGTTIAVTALAQDVSWALIARALQAGLTGLAFFVSVLIGRPLVYYLAREFAVGNDPALAGQFDAAHRLDKGRTFSFATIMWAIGLMVLCATHLTLALTQTPANFLLITPVLNLIVEGGLLVWTIRYARARLLPTLK